MWLPMAYINDYGGTLDYDQISHKNQDFQYNQNMDQYQILDLKNIFQPLWKKFLTLA